MAVEEKEEFEMGLPNGVGEQMLAHAYEKFDIKLEQTEFGPKIIGEYGGELPDYEISESGVMVLCKACPAYLNLLNNAVKTATGGEGKSKGKSKGMSKGNGKGKSRDISAEKIIRLLANNPSLRQKEVAGKMGLSLPGVEKIMRRLRSEGKLVREGSSRNGRWKVIRRE